MTPRIWKFQIKIILISLSEWLRLRKHTTNVGKDNGKGEISFTVFRIANRLKHFRKPVWNIPQKIKIKSHIWPNYMIPYYYPKGLATPTPPYWLSYLSDTCSAMFIVSLLIIPRKWNTFNTFSWRVKSRYTFKYYSAVMKDEIMNFAGKKIVLKGITQTQKDKHHTLSYEGPSSKSSDVWTYAGIIAEIRKRKRDVAGVRILGGAIERGRARSKWFNDGNEQKRKEGRGLKTRNDVWRSHMESYYLKITHAHKHTIQF